MPDQFRIPILSKRLVAAFCLLVIGCSGLIIADTATKQRDFDGEIKLSICMPDGKGGWAVKDTVSSNLKFGFNVTDLASGKVLKSDFVWSGRTANGAGFRARLAGQGQASFNPANGLIEERLPLEIEVNGKKETVQMPLTTESIRSAIGSLSGRRAQINGNIGEMALVGEAPLKQISLAETPAGKTADKIMVIAVLRGRVIAR